MQRFFRCISTICFSAGDEAQRCRVNWTKTGPQHMGPYRYLLPQAYFPTKLHSKGAGREEREGGGGEAGGRTNVGGRGLEGRKLGGREDGVRDEGGRGCRRELELG